MIDWYERIGVARADKIIEIGKGRDGTIIRRGSAVEYYSSGNRVINKAEICCVWHDGKDIVQAKLERRTGYSTGCLYSCPERMEGTCVAGTAWYADQCLSIHQGCEKCMSCVSTCKSEESCSLYEGEGKDD